MGNVVKVNINSLTSYADRLDNVNGRLAKVDRALDMLQFTTDTRNLSLVLSADWIIGSSRSLSRCSEYLRKTAADFEKVEGYLSSADPRTFEKPSYDIVTSDDWRDKIGHAVQVTVEEVSSYVSETVEAIKTVASETWNQIVYSYQSGGIVYKVAKVGGQAVNLGLGILEIVSAVGEVAVSGGALTPLAIAQIVDGGNKIISSSANITNMVVKGNYESDINLIKDTAGDVGQLIGGELGRKVGELAYFGFSFATDAGTFVKSSGELIDSAGTMIKAVRETSVKSVISSGYETVQAIKYTNVNLDTVKVVKQLVKGDSLVNTASNLVNAALDGKSLYDSAKDFRTGATNVAIQTVFSGAEYLLRRMSQN